MQTSRGGRLKSLKNVAERDWVVSGRRTALIATGSWSNFVVPSRRRRLPGPISIMVSIIESLNNTSSLTKQTIKNKCVLACMMNAMEASGMKRMFQIKRIENDREPKNKYSMGTKSCGIVTLRNCNGPSGTRGPAHKGVWMVQ